MNQVALDPQSANSSYPIPLEVIERFWLKVEKRESDLCWNWNASRTEDDGYGSFYFVGSGHVAHRFSYLLAFGNIPPGLFVCHRCNNKGCVNPAHLYAADNRTNTQDAVRDGLMVPHNSLRTCCSKCGGPYTKSKASGKRLCLACRKIANSRYEKTRPARPARPRRRAAMAQTQEKPDVR